MELPKEVQEKIARLQLAEQSAQNLHLQKQQFQAQLFDTEAALKELVGKGKALKAIGGVLVEVGEEQLRAELSERADLLKQRIGLLDQQERQLLEKTKKLQEEIAKELK